MTIHYDEIQPGEEILYSNFRSKWIAELRKHNNSVENMTKVLRDGGTVFDDDALRFLKQMSRDERRDNDIAEAAVAGFKSESRNWWHRT